MLWTIQLTAQEEPASPWQRVVPVASFGYGSLQSVYWSPVTGQLAAVSERGFQFYNADLVLQAERRLGVTPDPRVLFSPDMRYVAMIEAQGLIVHDTQQWEAILGVNTTVAPSWSPDSSLLAVWSGPVLQVWDVQAAQVRIELTELISENAPVQWSPDSQVIAVAAGETIVMVNVLTNNVVRVHDFAQIADFKWTRDGRWFFISGNPEPVPLDHDPHYPWPRVLVKLDAVTGTVVQRYTIPSTDYIYESGAYVSISPDGRFVATNMSRTTAAAVEPDKRSWSNVGMVMFDTETGNLLTAGRSADGGLGVEYTSWSPDSTRFATSYGNILQIFDVQSGQLVADLPAYIGATQQTVLLDDGISLVAAGGLWDVSGEYPEYLSQSNEPTPRLDYYQPPTFPTCTLSSRHYCPDFLVPDKLVFDYNKPPYDWILLQWLPERKLAITRETDIEYPDTPEYEDEEPPDERYVLWDTETGERLDERVYLGLQTAWIYDMPDAKIIESESRAFNIRRNTYFMGVGDDEIINLREPETPIPLEGINVWEWRKVWFGPEGHFLYTYDTDRRFKTFDPFTGKQLYVTVPAPDGALRYTADLTLTLLQNEQGILYIYDTETGAVVLQTYTANYNPLLLWNEDRSRLAIGGENRGIIIYDVPAQRRLGILRGHQGSITSMSWNPACDYGEMADCRYVFVSSDSNGQVILWGLEARDQLERAMPETPGEPVYDLPIAEINFAELSPLWSYLSLTGDFGKPQAQTIRWVEDVIRVNSNTYYTPALTEVTELPGSLNWLNPADIADDGRMVEANGTIYDAQGRPQARVAAAQVADATFDPSGERVITAEQGDSTYFSGWIREYSAVSGQFIRAWGGGNPSFEFIAYSPNQRWVATTTLAVGDYPTVAQVWFANRFNTQFSSLIGHTARITSLYWDGEDVLTSSLDGSVRRWNIRTGWPLARWNHPTRARVIQMDWYDDQSLLVSAGENLYLLEATTLTVQRTFEGVGGGYFAWSADRQQVTVIGSDAIIRVIDLASGAIQASQSQHMPPVTQLAWHPQGESLLAVRADGSIVLFDTLSGTVTKVLRHNGPALNSIAWNSQGTQLLLDVLNGPLQIIDGQTGALVAQINNPWRRPGVWWSPDGTRIVYGTYPDPTFDLYNQTSLLNIHATDGTLIHSLEFDWADFKFYHGNSPFEVVWSPDSNQIAAFYGQLQIWDVQSEQLLSNHPNMGVPTLTHWDNNNLDIWYAQSVWHLQVAQDELTRLNEAGVPVSAQQRADGLVSLAGDVIVHSESNYGLQHIPQT
ncbi:MAG TPA: WD40 repeat domain-containing protein [Phototrophicaceae bacterium]|nr:WD40 repeat domain-containing protein [Phototrophicaceae bacterium]